MKTAKRYHLEEDYTVDPRRTGAIVGPGINPVDGSQTIYTLNQGGLALKVKEAIRSDGPRLTPIACSYEGNAKQRASEDLYRSCLGGLQGPLEAPAETLTMVAERSRAGGR